MGAEAMTEAEFRSQFEQFRAMAERSPDRRRAFAMDWDDRLPCLEDRTRSTAFDRHYINHTAWAARVLAELRPASHVDIASSLYFATLVSAFIPVRYYEYRPVNVCLSGLTCDAADLLHLPFADRSLESISCMHVVEHVGLGRYGDPLDPDGDLKALRELQRVVAPGGSLLLVVPVGTARIQFNAHRIYAFDDVCAAMDELELADFALVPDRVNGEAIITHATRQQADQQRYGCGCFWLRRRRA